MHAIVAEEIDVAEKFMEVIIKLTAVVPAHDIGIWLECMKHRTARRFGVVDEYEFMPVADEHA